MTYSTAVAVLAISALVVILAIWGEHYSPWRRWYGKELGRLSAYTLGTLTIVLPTLALGLAFHIAPPPAAPVLWTLGGLVVNTIAAGFTTIATHSIDRTHKAEDRAQMYRQVSEVFHVPTDTPERD